MAHWKSVKVMRPFGAWRWRTLPAIALFLLLSACASSSYLTIPLTAGAADPELQQLAMRARAGDKRAQLELGVRFEEGRGVNQNFANAWNLYKLAAADGGGPMWVYSPSVGNGTRGRVIRIDGAPYQAGLVEAKDRLDVLSRVLRAQ